MAKASKAAKTGLLAKAPKLLLLAAVGWVATKVVKSKAA